ncbi:hypothetical protein BCR44DRAFT_406842 [Catenaria anguillulae PL171]|uniref:Uncharacterized protein n=1 Tax=Catenaria anguillulae PL171 TaxID=765915 RepID=A0A1Y2HP12_9FUNG|nr:hypothetical protein BCR44DRAFT_406842 [Catenaria anguillulae PL171]
MHLCNAVSLTRAILEAHDASDQAQPVSANQRQTLFAGIPNPASTVPDVQRQWATESLRLATFAVDNGQATCARYSGQGTNVIVEHHSRMDAVMEDLLGKPRTQAPSSSRKVISREDQIARVRVTVTKALKRANEKQVRLSGNAVVALLPTGSSPQTARRVQFPLAFGPTSGSQTAKATASSDPNSTSASRKRKDTLPQPLADSTSSAPPKRHRANSDSRPDASRSPTSVENGPAQSLSHPDVFPTDRRQITTPPSVVVIPCLYPLPPWDMPSSHLPPQRIPSTPQVQAAAAAGQAKVDSLLALYAKGSRPIPIPRLRYYPSSRVGPPTYLEPPTFLRQQTHGAYLILAPIPLHVDPLMNAILRYWHHDAFHGALDALKGDADQFVLAKYGPRGLYGHWDMPVTASSDALLAFRDSREWLFARNMYLLGIHLRLPEIPPRSTSGQRM